MIVDSESAGRLLVFVRLVVIVVIWFWVRLVRGMLVTGLLP